MRRKTNPISVAAGFTLLELLIVIGISGILSVMAIPQMGTFMHDYRVRNATRDLVTNINGLKLMAMKENARTVIKFDHNSDIYNMFIDNNSKNWGWDTNEWNRAVDLGAQGFQLTPNTLGFTSRGLPENGGGSLTLSNDAGSRTITVNAAGNVIVN